MMTKNTFRNDRSLIVALIAVFIAGCSATEASHQTSTEVSSNPQTTSDNPPLTRDQLDSVPAAWTQEHRDLRQQLTNMSQASRATHVDYCVVAPFGYSPCGGPANYLVYSREHKSATELESIEQSLTRYNELDKIINTQREIAGACRYQEPPRIALYENRCIRQLGQTPPR